MFDLDPLSYLKEEYPPEEFRKLNIPEYALPKVHSSLPDKPIFQDRQALLKQWVYNAFLYRYEKVVPPSATVLLFTWVIPDGFGDLTTQEEVATILKNAFPHLDLHLITLLEERVKDHPPLIHEKQTVLRFRKEEPYMPPSSLVPLLKKSALILQIPTYYPYWKEWEKELTQGTEVVSIGQYGFLENEHFHPQTANFCMGLRTLEKGLLLPTMPPATKAASSYFAYLHSDRGFAIYLHALLQREKERSTDITVIGSPPLPLLAALKNESFEGYGLKEIIIRDQAHLTTLTLSSKEGKSLLVEVKPFLTKREVHELYAREHNFVGCRGDRSFSEALAAKTLFFYEGPKHSLPFLYDLYELARHYLYGYPTLHAYLKCLLDRTSSPQDLGHTIADLLDYPATWEGMEKLSSWIEKNASFTETLKQLVTSKLVCEKAEDQALLTSFLEGKISLKQLL